MNYYPHHIGDFNAATRHLTRVERSLYRDAIELYYDKESPLIGDFDRLSRRLMAGSNEEKEALKFVLTEFFELVDGFYVNHRCEEEILSYRNNKTNKSLAGKASAAARAKRKADRLAGKNQQKSTGDEQVLVSDETEPQQNPTNQEPVTSNQEPVTKLNNDTRDKFQMFNGWVPTIDEQTQKALQIAGITQTDFDEQLPRYIASVIDDNTNRTQHEWNKGFKNSLMRFARSQSGKRSGGRSQGKTMQQKAEEFING